MRNKILNLGALSIVGASTLVVVACSDSNSKNNTTDSTNSNNTNNNNNNNNNTQPPSSYTAYDSKTNKLSLDLSKLLQLSNSQVGQLSNNELDKIVNAIDGSSNKYSSITQTKIMTQNIIYEYWSTTRKVNEEGKTNLTHPGLYHIRPQSSNGAIDATHNPDWNHPFDVDSGDDGHDLSKIISKINLKNDWNVGDTISFKGEWKYDSNYYNNNEDDPTTIKSSLPRWFQFIYEMWLGSISNTLGYTYFDKFKDARNNAGPLAHPGFYQFQPTAANGEWKYFPIINSNDANKVQLSPELNALSPTNFEYNSVDNTNMIHRSDFSGHPLKLKVKTDFSSNYSNSKNQYFTQTASEVISETSKIRRPGKWVNYESSPMKVIKNVSNHAYYDYSSKNFKLTRNHSPIDIFGVEGLKYTQPVTFNSKLNVNNEKGNWYTSSSNKNGSILSINNNYYNLVAQSFRKASDSGSTPGLDRTLYLDKLVHKSKDYYWQKIVINQNRETGVVSLGQAKLDVLKGDTLSWQPPKHMNYDAIFNQNNVTRDEYKKYWDNWNGNIIMNVNNTSYKLYSKYTDNSSIEPESLVGFYKTQPVNKISAIALMTDGNDGAYPLLKYQGKDFIDSTSTASAKYRTTTTTNSIKTLNAFGDDFNSVHYSLTLKASTPEQLSLGENAFSGWFTPEGSKSSIKPSEFLVTGSAMDLASKIVIGTKKYHFRRYFDKDENGNELNVSNLLQSNPESLLKYLLPMELQGFYEDTVKLSYKDFKDSQNSIDLYNNYLRTIFSKRLYLKGETPITIDGIEQTPSTLPSNAQMFIDYYLFGWDAVSQNDINSFKYIETPTDASYKSQLIDGISLDEDSISSMLQIESEIFKSKYVNRFVDSPFDFTKPLKVQFKWGDKDLFLINDFDAIHFNELIYKLDSIVSGSINATEVGKNFVFLAILPAPIYVDKLFLRTTTLNGRIMTLAQIIGGEIINNFNLLNN